MQLLCRSEMICIISTYKFEIRVSTTVKLMFADICVKFSVLRKIIVVLRYQYTTKDRHAL